MKGVLSFPSCTLFEIKMLTLTQYIFTPVLNIGVAVNVIVASLPPNFKVAPLRWMGLAILFYKH